MLFHKLTLSFFTLAFLFTTYAKDAPSLVIELFRHGARGPLYPDFEPTKSWGNDFGELTAGGMRMHYLLGAAMKEKYSHLLGQYDPSKIYVRSTDVNRTIMSVYSHLFGIFKQSGPRLDDESIANGAIPPYPSDEIQKIKDSLDNSYALPNNHQVVPVHVVPKQNDFVLRSYDACVLHSANWAKENAIDQESKDVFNKDLKYITEHLKSKNLKIQSFEDLHRAGDVAIANKFQNKQLPGQVEYNSREYKDLRFATEWYTVKQYEGRDIQRELYAAPLLETIKGYIDQASIGNSSLNFVILSAHDTTLMTLLAAFNVTTTRCLLDNYRREKEGKEILYPNCEFPPYASTIIFEYYNTSSPYIKMLYNGKEINLCGKSSTCSLQDFEHQIRSVTNKRNTEGYKTYCGLSRGGRGPKDTSGLTTLETILIPICSMLFMSLVGTCIMFRNKEKKGRRNVSHTESLIDDL